MWGGALITGAPAVVVPVSKDGLEDRGGGGHVQKLAPAGGGSSACHALLNRSRKAVNRSTKGSERSSAVNRSGGEAGNRQWKANERQ